MTHDETRLSNSTTATTAVAAAAAALGVLPSISVPMPRKAIKASSTPPMSALPIVKQHLPPPTHNSNGTSNPTSASLSFSHPHPHPHPANGNHSSSNNNGTLNGTLKGARNHKSIPSDSDSDSDNEPNSHIPTHNYHEAINLIQSPGTTLPPSNGTISSDEAVADASSAAATTPLTSVLSASHPCKNMSYSQRVARISDAVSVILECLGDDPRRQGLQQTPERYAKAMLALTQGNSQGPHDVVGDANFVQKDSQFVLVQDIHVFSLCEHHLLPFHGTCHVAYLPAGHVIGLSKVARIVDLYARRLQVQERLTSQIAEAIESVTNARGVMVLMSCTHMCMSMRGVQKVGAITTTTASRGRYESDAALRTEFHAMLRSPSAHR